MYRVEICDYERGSALQLKRILKVKMSQAVICSVSEEHLQAELDANAMRPDILFISVNLRTENGVALAARLQALDPFICVVFLAKKNDDVADIFEAEPVGLLMKPFCQDKIYATLERVMQRLEQERMNFLQLKNREHLLRVRYQEIRYIESDKRYLYIHRQDGSERVRMKLSEMETLLPDYFVRCHQSYIVNLNELASVNSNSLVLMDGTKFPVSRSRSVQTRKRIGECFSVKNQDKCDLQA